MHNSLGACKMIRYFLLALGLVFNISHATTWRSDTGWKLEPASDGVYSALPDTRPGQSHTTSCTSASCTRTSSLPTRYGSPPATVNPAARFPLGAIANGVLGLGNLAAAYNAGYALGEWLRNAGVRPAEGGGYETQEAPPLGDYGYGGGTWNATNQDPSRPGYSTAENACQAHLPWVVPGWTFVRYDYPGKVCVARAPGGWEAGVLNVDKVGTCAMGHADSNGLCPYTAEWRAAIASQALQKLVDSPPSPEKLSQIMDEVFRNGGSIDDDGNHTLTGPSTVTGSSSMKTVQRPDGTSAVSITNTTYNITYNNNSMSVTTTEKTTNPDGTTEETTTTPQKTECEKNPNSVGCADLTNNETAKPTWETKNVVYQVDSLGLPAACPAPWTGVVHGWNLSMSWQPACDVAPGIRAGVLALAALSALLLIITTIRQ